MSPFIKLDVPYYSQRDNKQQPNRTCNASSCCMVAEYLKPGVFGGSDDNYIELMSGYGDTVDHWVHTKLLESVGINSEFYYNLDYSDIEENLWVNKPVIIGVLHKGHYQTPYGGHILVVIGKLDADTYLVHDPWGEPFSYKNFDGSFKPVPKQSLNTRWLADGRRSGWGRIFN